MAVDIYIHCDLCNRAAYAFRRLVDVNTMIPDTLTEFIKLHDVPSSWGKDYYCDGGRLSVCPQEFLPDGYIEIVL